MQSVKYVLPVPIYIRLSSSIVHDELANIFE